MITQENAAIPSATKQGSHRSNPQIEIVTETLRGILRELDADLYQCVVCISALAAGKSLAPEDRAMMLAVARRVHGLARLQNHE